MQGGTWQAYRIYHRLSRFVLKQNGDGGFGRAAEFQRTRTIRRVA
jgi:hypothetical protein